MIIKKQKAQAVLNQGKTIDTKRFENFIANLPKNKLKALIDSFTKLFYTAK